MKYWVILYRTASGDTALTDTIAADHPQNLRMTDYVRRNMIQIYEVANPNAHP